MSGARETSEVVSSRGQGQFLGSRSSCRLLVITYPLLAIRYQVLGVRCWLLVISDYLLLTTCCLLVVVIDCWVFASVPFASCFSASLPDA